MKTRLKTLLVCGLMAMATNIAASADDESTIRLTQRPGWYEKTECPEDLTTANDVVASEKMRLEFFGWNPEEDYPFTLQFPTDKTYRRCILEYVMGGYPKPAEWDMLTEIQVYNPADGLWYEISRAITPYGGGYMSTWSKYFYFDVTEFLPLLQNEEGTNFRISYQGFDATETRAHAVTLRFHLFEGEPEDGPVLYTAQVYDSFRNGNNGYRAWAYGVNGHDIEDDERLGNRTIDIPENVHSGWLRVCFTGHGQEISTAKDYGSPDIQAAFPNREGYKVNNPAEFDRNTYTIFLHGEEAEEKGEIWQDNSKNYIQNGTYRTNRAGWGPGKPGNVHWWYVENLPSGGKWNINIDLEEYISNRTYPKAPYVANYYVSATLFGLEQETSVVKEIVSEETRKGCYDLMGRKINAENLKQGVYIVNNKKVVVGDRF